MDLEGLRSRDLSIGWRTADPEPTEVSTLVDTAADSEFWAAVRAGLGEEVTLLCERWAHGAYGYRWFRLDPQNFSAVAQAVSARSLLCVVADPDLRLRADLLDDGFTAFEAPLTPGQLAYRSYSFGADRLAEVTAEGYAFMLSDSALSQWCAVVPDADGVVRGQWEDFGE
ncbi:hypothetical protein [Streptomyces sp. NPDC002994]|uniref:hypothetical protein n=1 Tax=Streptomyces sp. NPDC002994 TaxID=3154441 RepID=UPI0033BDFEDE